MPVAPTKKTARGQKSKNGLPNVNGKKSHTNGDHASPQIDPERLLAVLTAVCDGDFTGRLPKEKGVTGEVYDALNSIIEKNQKLTLELGRISEVVGKEGKLSERAVLKDAEGGWGSCIDSVNTLIADLARPTTEVARVI